RMSPWFAGGLAIVLIIVGCFISMALLPIGFLQFAGFYLLNSIAYCLLLKHQVIADVLSIAIGFVLRLLAGCAAIGAEPSSLTIVCGFSLAPLLGFAKRKLELGNLQQPGPYRPILPLYSAEKLNLLLGITASLCLLSYMLYTVSPETIRLH